MTGTVKQRKFGLSVGVWGSEESIFTWKYCKTHLLQPKESTLWQDSLTVVHVNSKKDKDRWDVAGPVMPDVATATQAYNTTVKELEGDPPLVLVEYVNKEHFDVFIIANRGRNVMKKAMMGSTTEFIMHRVNCPCLIVKPQVCAGDTYRLRTSASSGGPPGVQLVTAPALAAPTAAACRSPNSSPMFGRLSSLPSGVATPFNRRVAIAYDTTANGRYLLKWAAENLLEAADNIFVVRAVPKVRTPTTSFADKHSVQRLAGEVLPSLPHVTPFNLYQGNARKAVLAFVEKESIDLLVLGMYSEKSTRRKGLALRGNASALYNRSACPTLVVPLSEGALARSVRPSDLALTAEEEEELASGSESESDEEEGTEGTEAGTSAAQPRQQQATPASAEKKATTRRGPIESFFKRRGSAETGGSTQTSSDGGAVKGSVAAVVAAAALSAGAYLVEVDGAGGVKSIVPAGRTQLEATASPAATTSGVPEAASTSAAGAAGAQAGSSVEAELKQRLLEKEREIEALRQQLASMQQGRASAGGTTDMQQPSIGLNGQPTAAQDPS